MSSTLETVIVSDMHLSEAHEPDAERPLWMAYKQRRFFFDDEFAAFLHYIHDQAKGPLELVLNGDIFDFDNILTQPDNPVEEVQWLERQRGLASEEWMSEFKMRVIIRDHPRWFEALGEFIRRGHRAVFVIGNHDMELYWPSVQRLVCEALGVPMPASESDHTGPVVFCDWFYLSGEDTYISHGHQYDPNCVVPDPTNPLIEVRGRARVRIPFGDLAGRYMLNGMGYFNPHASDNYIREGVIEYLRFFFRYMVRTQPLLIWTWFWGALTTFWIAMRTHWLHSMRDPLLVDEKVNLIARRSQATTSQVRKLNALHVPSACNNPLRIARELWLDRAFLFLAVVFLAWQVVLHINIAWPISPLWAFVPMAILLLPYLAYAASVKPTVFEEPLLDARRAELIHRITGVERVVFGHTHQPLVKQIGPVTLYNGGFWSAAFAEPECINRIGRPTFVWIRPGAEGQRTAGIHEWTGAEPAPFITETPSQIPHRVAAA